ncbi:ExbD/TolR family protein [Xanthobacteraceae bacterium A53D]
MLSGLVAMCLAQTSAAVVAMVSFGTPSPFGMPRAEAVSMDMPGILDLAATPLTLPLVAAPLVTAGVPVQLPQTQVAEMAPANGPLVISMTGKGQIFIQETEVAPDQLEARLKAMAPNADETRIILRADKAVGYEAVMAIMGRLSAAGFKRVGLMTEQGG